MNYRIKTEFIDEKKKLYDFAKPNLNELVYKCVDGQVILSHEGATTLRFKSLLGVFDMLSSFLSVGGLNNLEMLFF